MEAVCGHESLRHQLEETFIDLSRQTTGEGTEIAPEGGAPLDQDLQDIGCGSDGWDRRRFTEPDCIAPEPEILTEHEGDGRRTRWRRSTWDRCV